MKQDYAETDPEDTSIREKIETIDSLLDDPDVKTALLERMRVGE
ncbi:hypothetical protein [Haloarchaeobius sp. HME9146]|nr:hypothetical protein [Haloarchaeobius sp. HME9146]MCT9095167.1 hypothetical protein [Haloarchaeobius sp. HME9146]